MLILVYLEMVLILTQDSCMVSQNVPYAQKLFWMHPMVLLGDEAQVDDRFGLFEDSANLMQNRCTVCVERTIGSQIILDTPDRTPS
jgi:hypothetical protein